MIVNWATAEIYDPSTNTFIATGNMTIARSQHTATLLPNGTVLIAGGDGGLGSMEVYDPSSGTFSTIGTPSALTASPVPYDPSTGAFAPAGSLYSPSGGLYSTATWLADRLVLLNGGTAALLLPDGMVLTFWGGVWPGTFQLYDPRTATFGGPSPTTLLGSEALLLTGKILLAGGNDDPGDSNLAEVYDPLTGTVAPTGSMTAFRADDPTTLLPDGKVLIAGSNGDAGQTLASAELYDPASGTFARTADMTVDRGLHTATLLNNGQVLIAGGVHYVAGQGWPPLSGADLYTPASVTSAPSLFSLSGDGQGQGAIWSAATGQIASSQNPALAGEVLAMYTTSLGNGSVIPPSVAVGGQLAQVLYFGDAPGYPGYDQVNFRVPGSVAPGSAVSVRFSYLGRTSNAVTIAVE